MMRDMKYLFEPDRKNYHESTRIGSDFYNKYIEHEINGGKNETMFFEE